mmetsp:Transcript_112690/g.314857  ORF Transcript_112690/g.314857 Transcript_112690/m.314857 type:complete len:104 (+) Transcript_112690:572-883(+)
MSVPSIGMGTLMPAVAWRRRSFMLESVPFVLNARRSSSRCTSRNRSFEIKSIVSESIDEDPLVTFSSKTALLTATLYDRPFCLKGTNAFVEDNASRKLATTDV